MNPLPTRVPGATLRSPHTSHPTREDAGRAGFGISVPKASSGKHTSFLWENCSHQPLSAMWTPWAQLILILCSPGHSAPCEQS